MVMEIPNGNMIDEDGENEKKTFEEEKRIIKDEEEEDNMIAAAAKKKRGPQVFTVNLNNDVVFIPISLRYAQGDEKQVTYVNFEAVTIPKGLKNKRKAFRFMNYIADTKEFSECVKSEWDHEIKGCNMYKLVHKLKRLKKPLNKLNCKNGNLTEKVAALKKNLKEIQAGVEKNPVDYNLKD
nr:hypothetical protein [Tanacetum cinerariifolium]